MPTSECAACRDEDKTRQRKASGGIQPEAAVPSSVSEVLRQPGEPLDAASRAYFEPRFKRDFSAVRIHADPAAAQSARTVDALAYTVGRHIVFGSGQRVADTPAGRALLAHELTHVVQQAGGTALAAPGAAQERDAEAAVRCVMSGTIPQVRAPSGVGLAAQRRADTSWLVSKVIPYEPEPRIVRFDDISALVNRVIKSPRTTVRDGRTDFNNNPQLAKTRLYHSHFRSDEERLSYALGMFEPFLASGTGVVDPDELHQTLWTYEVQVQSRKADLVVHSPPTKAERQRLNDLLAERSHRRQEQLGKLLADRTPATRAKRYDLNLAQQGKSPSDPQNDVVVDLSILTKDEFLAEWLLRGKAELQACEDENIRPGTKEKCRLAVKEKYMGKEYMEQSFAAVRAQWNDGAYIETIKSSGPLGLGGRAMGRGIGYLIAGDKGADRGEGWGALGGDIADMGVMMRAGAAERGRIEAYEASGGLEVGLGEIIDVTNAPRPAGDITEQPSLGPDEAFRPLGEEMAATETDQPAPAQAKRRNQTRETGSAKPTAGPATGVDLPAPLPAPLAELQERSGVVVTSADVEGGVGWKLVNVSAGDEFEAFGLEGKTSFKWVARVPEENWSWARRGNQLVPEWYTGRHGLAEVMVRYRIKMNQDVRAAMSKVADQKQALERLGPAKFQYYLPEGFERFATIERIESVTVLIPGPRPKP